MREKQISGRVGNTVILFKQVGIFSLRQSKSDISMESVYNEQYKQVVDLVVYGTTEEISPDLDLENINCQQNKILLDR